LKLLAQLTEAPLYLFVHEQRRTQAAVSRSGALPAVLELVELSGQYRAVPARMVPQPASPYGFTQLEAALVQAVQCFAVHEAFRPALMEAGIGRWLADMLGREAGQEALAVQDLAAEALYWLLEDDACDASVRSPL
jgi:hypothetical protein